MTLYLKFISNFFPLVNVYFNFLNVVICNISLHGYYIRDIFKKTI